VVQPNNLHTPEKTTTTSRWRRPSLRIESTAEGVGHASWIELFFDLVFVVVIAELSHSLEQHLTLAGFLQFAALFVPCWWAWVIFTFYADRYDTDDVIHRLLILSGMLSVMFLAGNIHNAFTQGWTGFVLSYIAIRSIVLLLYVRAARHVPAAAANLKLYLTSYLPSTILWLLSITFPPARYLLWAMAMAIELIVPIAGSKLLAGTPVHPSHLPERFGLVTLIVLGESIVSVAAATADTNWQLSSTIAAVGGFAIAACLWWLYFNFLETAVIIRGIGSVHVYNYGHLPILMGLTLVAVGTQRTILEVNESVLAAGSRWALCGGVALYLLSIGFIWISGCRRRVTGVFIGSVAVSIGLAVAGGLLAPLAVEGLLLLVLVTKVSFDIFRSRSTGEIEKKTIKMDVDV
jgi:low temperature requirement protein LtrA